MTATGHTSYSVLTCLSHLVYRGEGACSEVGASAGGMPAREVVGAGHSLSTMSALDLTAELRGSKKQANVSPLWK